jgi:hypothetical protein
MSKMTYATGLFKETPSQFQEKVLNLIPKKQARIKEQPGET